MPQKDDKELIADYIAGDEAAIEQLVERHLGNVYSFVLRFVGNEHEADDITQETFFKAWKNLHKYRPETSRFSTWVLRIARNTAIDHLRTKKHVHFSELEGEEGENLLAEILPDPGELQDEAFAKIEDEAELRRALVVLSPKHREVLLLHYTNHLTFGEIAELLAEPQNTVKSRHRRALVALRKILEAKAPK